MFLITLAAGGFVLAIWYVAHGLTEFGRGVDDLKTSIYLLFGIVMFIISFFLLKKRNFIPFITLISTVILGTIISKLQQDITPIAVSYIALISILYLLNKKIERNRLANVS